MSSLIESVSSLPSEIASFDKTELSLEMLIISPGVSESKKNVSDMLGKTLVAIQ